jgi:hypothetical protein
MYWMVKAIAGLRGDNRRVWSNGRIMIDKDKLKKLVRKMASVLLRPPRISI